MLVTGLPESQLVLIEKSFEEHAIRGTARFTYENVLESLIIRLMPGAAHEHTSRDFYVTLVTKIATLPGHSIRSIRSVGATHFVVPGKRSKQGDEGLRPATRTLITDWPSIMIEVGYSETLAYLRLDAAWWLENTQRQTRMAIIIKIAVNPCSMVLECWEMQESQNSPSTRGPDVQPACTQHFDIDNKGSVTPLDASLIIPYLTIFDTPHDDGADIILTSAELSEFATFLFGGLK
ncbi:hypothetical protein HOY80DRAFT_897200 [Tuber brumale]|nr:hypothetical protein HOY80DRAFT_897200 [Tuber brumale]